MSFLSLKRSNYYLVLLYRLVIVLILFFLCRILFFLLNPGLFPGITFSGWVRIFKGGFVFDIAALFYFNALFIVLSLLPLAIRTSDRYQRAIKYIFYFMNGLAVMLNCIDFIYYRFTLRRTTRSIFGEFSHETNKSKLAGRFLMDYWYVVIIFIALVALMIWLYNRVKIQKANPPERRMIFYAHSIIALPLAIVLAVGGIRGDFKYSTRPITISNAGEYVKSPNEMYLVLNTPFCMVRTWNVKRLAEMHYYSDEEVEKIFSPVHHPKTDSTKSFQKKNVVIFILESFGKEAVGGYNKDLDNGTYTGYTPFLDSLMGVSKIYWNSFATGRKSIDAIPSILASIPNGQDPFVLTPYASDSTFTLPKILREKGYTTSFFHGAPNGSMGFQALVNLLGVEHYYGKNEYNNDNDFDGIWGIWDEPFFQYFASVLDTMQQPFMGTLFSVSSHHPFKVPAQYKGKFKKGPLPVLECINYTDMSLRRFFEKASHSEWFKNTVFVISADHSMINYHPEYGTLWGDVAIPILLYSPGDSSFHGLDQGVIQQTDIMPSLLSYLNYDKPYVAFGENVFDKNRLNFSVCYGGGYRWIEGDYLLFFDGEKTKSLYNYKTDRLFKDNLLDKKPEIVVRMERNLKAFIQQYNNRLIRNQLTVNKNAR
ncbi:MAG: sulfatase-like hydrolase/transferase [Bacteroidetes bacterium]|nr:sulfatase-like hydrolase/transferase [Bacteroidota bacterium]